MRFAVLMLSALLFVAACKESEKNEIYNENNTTVKDGIVYNIDETPINGLYRTYYTNGTVKMEVYSQNGKPNGLGKFYTEDGTLLYEGTFSDGVPVGTMYHYYRNGKVHNEQNYVSGVLHGTQQTYSKKGELTVEVIFDQGKALSGYAVVNGEKIEFTPEELVELEK
ncbi:MAG: hypothetical protein IJ770_02305 [Alphaproteobacteria bacterium]|nr:hypothetical protein [Alphaproteobacteria bacterium]